MKDFKPGLFKDAVVPEPKLGGDWGGSKNGVSIPGGREGTPGVMPEVTTVDLPGGVDNEGKFSGSSPIANRDATTQALNPKK